MESTTPIRTPSHNGDGNLFRNVEETLYTAVIADSLDELGYRNHAMDSSLRPIGVRRCFSGWARTVAYVDIYHIPDDPYGLEIEAIDSIQPDEVVVISTGNSVQNAPWGELLSTAAKARGARGAVVEGLVRDVRKIDQLAFPVFATGIKPVDSKGRGLVLNYNVRVRCAGVQVDPGDFVVADDDGVVVVPQAVLQETLRLAAEKVMRENNSRQELMSGVYLRQVYDKYGVL